MEGNATTIRGYLGYVLLHHDVPTKKLDLEAYREPHKLISFFAYLKARGVNAAHLVKHVATAKKVREY